MGGDVFGEEEVRRLGPRNMIGVTRFPLGRGTRASFFHPFPYFPPPLEGAETNVVVLS